MRDLSLTQRLFAAAILIVAVGVLGSWPQNHAQSITTPAPSENEIPRAARIILEQADQFELLSLDPTRQSQPPMGDYHGYKVLGRTLIEDAETREKLVSALEAGAAENQGMIAMCFNPRHGIRVTRKRKTVDFVICFECRQVYLYGDVRGHFLVSDSPQPVFDQVLGDAKLPLSRPKRRTPPPSRDTGS